MNEIAKHSMEAISTYQNDLEQDMNNAYRQFIDEDFPYIIRLDGDSITDRDKIHECQRNDIELGILTVKEVREQLDRILTLDEQKGIQAFIYGAYYGEDSYWSRYRN